MAVSMLEKCFNCGWPLSVLPLKKRRGVGLVCTNCGWEAAA